MAHTYQKEKEKEKTKIFVTEECLRALNISFVCIYSQLLSLTLQEGLLFIQYQIPAPFKPCFFVVISSFVVSRCGSNFLFKFLHQEVSVETNCVIFQCGEIAGSGGQRNRMGKTSLTENSTKIAFNIFTLGPFQISESFATTSTRDENI